MKVLQCMIFLNLVEHTFFTQMMPDVGVEFCQNQTRLSSVDM